MIITKINNWCEINLVVIFFLAVRSDVSIQFQKCQIYLKINANTD